jgi:hypothetical protein
MPASLAALAALLLAAMPAARRAETPAWTPVLTDAAMVVELDTTRVTGGGPYTAWLRWRFTERVASPGAWDAGVRWTMDYVEVDCAAGEARTRTFSSIAYTADGALIEDASYENPVAPWRRATPESVGEIVARSVCAAAPR